MSAVREFKDVRKGGPAQEALPVDVYMEQLEQLQAEIMTEKNVIWERVADGSLAEPYVRRLCLEYYYLGKFYTTEFASLVANAPDADALDMNSSEHFLHWLQNLADETGFAGDRNHVDMKVEWARVMGISDDELETYRPMPETVGSVFTSLYYMRKSYEEGLAAFGWAGERLAASTGYAKLMYEGLRDHYDMDVENFRVHAYAEEDHGDKADYLLRQVVTTAAAQRKVRRCIEHTLLCRNQRNVALNKWLDDPDALRR